MLSKVFSTYVLAVLALSVLAAPLPAQESSQPQGYIQDWSHRHLVFSNPGTYEEAVQNGTVDKWTQITNDPRYIIQQRARTAVSAPIPKPDDVPSPIAATTKKLKKDWSTGLGGLAASLTGTVGTLSSSSISGSSTLSVDGTILTASAPTAASATGTAQAFPTSTTAPTLTVSSGANAITLTTNATAKAATGTITSGTPGAPLTGQTIVIPSNAGSIALTPGGNPATMTGSVSGTISSAITLTYNNGGGTANTLSLTPSAATQGTVVGTFTASGTSTGQFTPGTTVGTFVVTSGSNTATLTPNGFGYFTVSTNPPATDTATVNSEIYTFETSVSTTAKQVLIGSSAAQTAQNLAAAIMKDSTMCANAPSACFGSSTLSYTGVTASYDGSGHTYIFNSTSGSIGISDSAGGDITESSATITQGSNSCSGSGTSIAGTFGAIATASGGTSSSAANIKAALNLCTNLGMTATSTNTTVTATNTAYGTTPAVSTSESLGGFSSAATQGTGTSGCPSSSTTGNFPTYAGITTAIEASNISSAINACHTSYPTVGATSSYTSGTTFLVMAAAPGSAVTLSGTAPTGFSWSASTLGNETGAGTCTSGTAGTFVNSGVANTLANNIYTVLNSSSCTGSPGSSGVTATYSSGNTFTVTANALGSSPVFTDTGSTSTVISWSSISGGSNGSNACTGSGPWTATFASSSTLTTIAADVTAAITACTSGSKGVTATGNAVVSTTALGSGATLTVTSNNPGIFSWSSVTAGTDGTNSSTTFAYWSVNTYLSSAQVATNITNAVNSNATLQSVVSAGANAPANGDVTFLAVATGTNTDAVTPGSFTAFTGGSLSGGSATPKGTVQPNTYPAKFSFSTSAASCASDFVVYPTGTAVETTSASIAAYENLYSGCTGTVPSVFWTYSTGGAVTTSPILSLDGTQVAFIQENTGGVASLVLLKWAAYTSGSLTSQTSGSNYQSCAAPCMYTLTFNGSPKDTFSSPFYSYDDDVLYVGDDSGKLHQFTGVFNGAPAENTTSPWPVSLSTTSQLASPVFDVTWDAVFIGDLGGVLHCVTASSGSCQTSQTSLGNGWSASSITPASSGQIADAPLVDGSANYLLAFVNTSTSNSVYGFSEQYFPGGEGGPVSVGSGGTGYYLYAGTFDNVYYQSSDHTGNIYVIGNTGVTTGATLYQVALSGGFLTGSASSAVTDLTVSATDAYPWPSPVSEFCNPGSNAACALNTGGTATTTGTDYVFFSVYRGNETGCTTGVGNGCILSYNISTPTHVVIAGSGLNVTTPGTSTTNGCWATGGIVIDNSVPSGTLAGASEIYLVNLDGSAAGNPSTLTSSKCGGSVASVVIDGVQAAQSGP